MKVQKVFTHASMSRIVPITAPKRIRVIFFPKNLKSITMDETQTADDVREKVMAEAMDKSVYSNRGLINKTSAPLHTYMGIPTSIMIAVDRGSLPKLRVSK
jgi:hypothetical protein